MFNCLIIELNRPSIPKQTVKVIKVPEFMHRRLFQVIAHRQEWNEILSTPAWSRHMTAISGLCRYGPQC